MALELTDESLALAEVQVRAQGKRQLLCVVFADMVGYSALISENETETHEMWMRFSELVVAPLISKHSGNLVRTLGDGILSTFSSATDALGWAMDIQRVILDNRNARARPFPGLSLRIGINICDAILDGGDVYGDGVNITKRLQETAAADGIIISESLHESVRKGTDLRVRNLGFLTLKNISDPVRCFEVILDRATSGPTPVIDRNLPSIAVLPFQNLSGDPSFDYFSDGVVEDIIVSLSALRELFVISRSSAIAFGTGPTDPREIGRVLGVRYSLQGTLRLGPSTIRASVSLNDTRTGETLFSEKSEFPHSDLFAVQDMIVERVVARIAPNVRASERTKALRKPPENFTAYDLTLKAIDLMGSLQRDRFDQAIGYLDQAMELDPEFAMPAAYATRWYCIKIGQGWSTDLEGDCRKAAKAASQAISVDRQNALALAYYGHMKSYLERDYDTALIFLDRARDVGPSHAIAWMLSSATLAYVGRSEEAIKHAEYGLRLSPHDPDLYQFYDFLSIAHYSMSNFDEALIWAKRSHSENPKYTSNLRVLASCLVAKGELSEANRISKKLLELQPDFTVSNFGTFKCPFQMPEVKDMYLRHLRLAGLPN